MINHLHYSPFSFIFLRIIQERWSEWTFATLLSIFYLFLSHHPRAIIWFFNHIIKERSFDCSFASYSIFFFASYKSDHLIIHSQHSWALSIFYSFLPHHPRAIIWFLIRIIKERSFDYSFASLSFYFFFLSHHSRAIIFSSFSSVKRLTFHSFRIIQVRSFYFSLASCKSVIFVFLMYHSI